MLVVADSKGFQLATQELGGLWLALCIAINLTFIFSFSGTDSTFAIRAKGRLTKSGSTLGSLGKVRVCGGL